MARPAGISWYRQTERYFPLLVKEQFITQAGNLFRQSATAPSSASRDTVQGMKETDETS